MRVQATTLLLAAVALGVDAQNQDTTATASDSRSIVTLSGTSFTTTFTGTYASDNTIQVTVGSSLVYLIGDNSVTATSTANETESSTTITTSRGTTSLATLLVGGGVGVQTLSIINGTTTIFPSITSAVSNSTTASSTSTAARPTNTQACNNYPEFCSRQYSNITEVCAHNSAFNRRGNAGSNQALTITQQLNDGIRMIQGEVQYVNDTLYSCHTSCNLLNAGTYQSTLEEVADWVRGHPYDVVTLLIVNSNYVNVRNFSNTIQAAGLGPYVYTPPKIPMHLNDWPTLSEMILSQKRVVVFMDYQANQTAVPYILDQYTHMWETPFSPQNVSFPCTVQRPPTLKNMTRAKDQYMYLANHNLNQAISLAGMNFLVPNTAELSVTNAAGNQTGMLGAMAETCEEDWGRAPNFLLVDYYNIGNGSVFEVAAKYNNVTYDRKCCGVAATNSAPTMATGLPYWAMWVSSIFIGLVLTT